MEGSESDELDNELDSIIETDIATIVIDGVFNIEELITKLGIDANDETGRQFIEQIK